MHSVRYRGDSDAAADTRSTTHVRSDRLRVEDIPIVTGVLVALLGAALVWDAWGPQALGPKLDRRRRAREPLDTRGELMAGLGIAFLGGALIGRDWRFETVTVLLGTILVLLGGFRNRRYFREVFLFRGAARRDSASPGSKKRAEPTTWNRNR